MCYNGRMGIVRKKSSSKGFTLIELSIVLIIVSLIAAGIVGGRSLILAAEVRGISSDISKYTAAIYMFREQYDHFPGDFPFAQDYWPDGYTPGYHTTNGDGNGIVNDGDEHFAAFQHMWSAELIDTEHTRTSYQDAARKPGSVIFQYTNQFKQGNGLFIAHIAPITALGIVTPAELHGIDKKIDDGFATDLNGRLFGRDDPDGPCSSGLNYALSNKQRDCRIYYFPKF